MNEKWKRLDAMARELILEIGRTAVLVRVPAGLADGMASVGVGRDGGLTIQADAIYLSFDMGVSEGCKEDAKKAKELALAKLREVMGGLPGEEEDE